MYTPLNHGMVEACQYRKFTLKDKCFVQNASSSQQQFYVSHHRWSTCVHFSSVKRILVRSSLTKQSLRKMDSSKALNKENTQKTVTNITLFFTRSCLTSRHFWITTHQAVHARGKVHHNDKRAGAVHKKGNQACSRSRESMSQGSAGYTQANIKLTDYKLCTAKNSVRLHSFGCIQAP